LRGIFVGSVPLGCGRDERSRLQGSTASRSFGFAPSVRPSVVVPDFEHVHREPARPSVTLSLLRNEYAAKCGESSTRAARNCDECRPENVYLVGCYL
jgi:hypothetical protein